MKLSAWAREQGVSYQTAYSWYRKGILPVPAEQLPTGTILVHPPRESAESDASVVLYARVSSADQKADLERQVGRLTQFASDNDLIVKRSVAEIGSGLNGRRPKLVKLLADRSVTTIVVEHTDRLARFGAEYLEAALTAAGRRLIVVEDGEMKDDLVQDMIDVMTSFCARLYGRRSAKRRAKKAVAAVSEGG